MPDLPTRIDVLSEQEDLLRFPSFTRATAWDFGRFMVERAERLGITIAVSIRTANGAVVFQYLPEGTNHLNELWMRRKFNTVTTFESSSLKAAYVCESNETQSPAFCLTNRPLQPCNRRRQSDARRQHNGYPSQRIEVRAKLQTPR